MKRNLTIISNTFSFILVFIILWTVHFVFPENGSKSSLIGYSIAIIFFGILHKFWAKPLYVENLFIENNTLIINYTNPFLKKSKQKYNLLEISNFKINKRYFFQKNSSFEFEYMKVKNEYSYFNSEKKLIKEIENLIKVR